MNDSNPKDCLSIAITSSLIKGVHLLFLDVDNDFQLYITYDVIGYIVMWP
jgi:hypothetical protein